MNVQLRIANMSQYIQRKWREKGIKIGRRNRASVNLGANDCQRAFAVTHGLQRREFGEKVGRGPKSNVDVETGTSTASADFTSSASWAP